MLSLKNAVCRDIHLVSWQTTRIDVSENATASVIRVDDVATGFSETSVLIYQTA
jgi:hypothetical protein